MKIKSLLAFLVFFASMATLDASAAEIPGVFNTGDGFSGEPQGAYLLANTTDSQWLTPLASPATSFDSTSNGDLLGFDASSVDPALLLVRPVPEPETYAMLVAGLGLLMLFARRRKQIGR